MINVQVEKTGNENNLNLLRRFTKRVQEAGVLPRVRSLRYSDRNRSKYVKKKKKLESLRRKDAFSKLVKMGKAVEKKRR
ncbi:30S ribosomal protein S21 [Candidatus Nomurabacteria bacterium]|nr:30S ribosomal protein S21 [Candidatus Nomurabacteria bacterium]